MVLDQRVQYSTVSTTVYLGNFSLVRLVTVPRALETEPSPEKSVFDPRSFLNLPHDVANQSHL